MSSPGLNATSLRFKTFRQTNDDLPNTCDFGRLDHIPDHHNMMNPTNSDSPDGREARMHCCCGRLDCAYLEHNVKALSVIERDLDRAANLGQVRALHLHEHFYFLASLCSTRPKRKILCHFVLAILPLIALNFLACSSMRHELPWPPYHPQHLQMTASRAVD